MKKNKIINKKVFFSFNLKKKFSSQMKKSFNFLKDDTYLKSRDWIFRKRSYGRGKIIKSKIIWSKQTNFFQKKKNNKYVGGIKRKFAAMKPVIKKEVEIIILNLKEKNLIGKDIKFFGAHAIRIICDKNNLGYPVPEGYHHDGFDFVSIIAVNRSNILGGKSYLKNATSKKIVFTKSLKNNQALFFNDKKLLHYATPIKLTKGRLGFRDMIVLTFSK